MLKLLRWSTISGFTVAAGYFWQKGDWEIALTSIIIPVLAGLAPLLFQMGPKEEKTGESWLKNFFSNKDFKNQYFTLLRYQNRDFDIKGMSTQTKYTLELDKVFIELKLQPQAAHKATADPLQVIPAKYRKDSYPIWRFFSLLSDDKAQNPKLVIVGPPGSGKTTLLRHMALLLAISPQKDDFNKTKINKIPIVLYLRDYVNDVVNNPSILLPDIINSSLRKWDITVVPDWFSSKLKRGECLVLLDGLDEVAEPASRRKIVGWLENQIQAYPKNAFIITSRPHGYKENPIRGATVLEVMPFNRTQIDNFIQGWYLANEINSHLSDDLGVRMSAKSGADDLLRRLERTPTLMELAVNPLLLTMIATVHRFRSALPGRRVELYKEICEVFLGRRQESKGITIDMVPSQKQFILQTLAFEMMESNIREIRKPDALEIIKSPLAMVAPTLAPEVFLKSIEQQTGLLLERELGIYSFTHKTFQEYLASMNILDNNLETKLYDRINDDWWHEVIKLYSAQTDASEIIRICLDQDPPSAVALSLAVQCLEEAQQVQPELRIIAEKILFENAEDADLDIRKIIAQALLSSRLKHLSALSPSIFIDTKLVTNAEYQLFVDDMLWRGKGDYYPSHWESKSFPSGSAHEPALGLTPEDSVSFCEWLTELHAGSGEWYFRLPVKEEIITENYLELPGFWMLRDSHNTNPNKHQFVTLWENIQFGLPHVPDKFILKQTEEEIKKILAYLRFGNDIPELNDSLFLELGNVLKKLLASSTNSKELLSKSANELFINIKNTSYSRPVDFGYNLLDTETYDQALSDLIYQFDKDDFEDGIMCSVKCFSNIINSTHRSSNRLKTLFVSFAFVLIIKWIEKNKSLFAKVDTQGTQQKIDYLVDRYIDYLIILGRQNGVVKPFEGLLIVKEIRDRTFDG